MTNVESTNQKHGQSLDPAMYHYYMYISGTNGHLRGPKYNSHNRQITTESCLKKATKMF